MKRIGLFLAAILSLGVAGPCLAAPLAVYGGLPRIEEVAISSDGQYLALSVTDGEQRTVAIERTSDRQFVSAIKAGTRKLRALQWAGPNHVLITLSAFSDLGDDMMGGSSEHWGVIDFNITTKTQTLMLKDVPGALNVVFATPETRIIDGKPYAYLTGAYYPSNDVPIGSIALFRTDLDKHQTRVVMQGLPHAEDFFIDANGEVTAQATYDAPTSQWALRIKDGGQWRVAKTVTAAIEHPYILGLGRDGKSMLLLDHVEGERALREMSVDASDWSKPFLTGDTGLITDPNTGRLAATISRGKDGYDYHFIEPRDQVYWDAAVAAYPDQGVSLSGASADGRKLVVLVDSPTDGPAYALVDLDAKSATWIGQQYAVEAQDVGEKRAIAFKAADGLELSGYVTLPPGRAAKNLPLVVLAHGGPASSDDPGFDWWSQAIASRGYAVLQVNYRGSDGFGWKFMSAGFGQWGRKMQTDLSDGARYLAAQGMIDPKRVCIVGASYGGYAALAGATLDTGVYRCAASVAGPADLSRMVRVDKADEGRQGVGLERYWSRFMGSSNAADPVLRSISPAFLADKVSIPILLIHGKEDTVVPFEQSQIMADALKKAGKPYQFVILKEEDHWLSRGVTRQRMLQAMVDFLERNNPPS